MFTFCYSAKLISFDLLSFVSFSECGNNFSKYDVQNFLGSLYSCFVNSNRHIFFLDLFFFLIAGMPTTVFLRGVDKKKSRNNNECG